MSTILIKNALIVTMNDKILKGDIFIENDKIAKIDKQIKKEADKIIDANNNIVMPGFINTYSKAGTGAFRGLVENDFTSESSKIDIKYNENMMSKEDLYTSSMSSLIEMIKTGTTTYADMYGPHMESVIEATIKAGIRGVIARGAIGLFPAGRQILEDNVKLFENYHGAGDGLITIMMGVHAPYTCPPEFCEYARELAVKHQIPIHIHMNETQAEIKQIQEQYGKRPFKYIEDTGLFELPAIAAHCVWLDDEDIAIMKKHNISAIHNLF
jgi:5-methylthioadenosine/S-adenosylhomocysteine deaminase